MLQFRVCSHGMWSNSSNDSLLMFASQTNKGKSGSNAKKLEAGGKGSSSYLQLFTVWTKLVISYAILSRLNEAVSKKVLGNYAANIKAMRSLRCMFQQKMSTLENIFGSVNKVHGKEKTSL